VSVIRPPFDAPRREELRDGRPLWTAGPDVTHTHADDGQASACNAASTRADAEARRDGRRDGKQCRTLGARRAGNPQERRAADEVPRAATGPSREALTCDVNTWPVGIVETSDPTGQRSRAITASLRGVPAAWDAALFLGPSTRDDKQRRPKTSQTGDVFAARETSDQGALSQESLRVEIVLVTTSERARDRWASALEFLVAQAGCES
jgi:hypothetical protein